MFYRKALPQRQRKALPMILSEKGRLVFHSDKKVQKPSINTEKKRGAHLEVGLCSEWFVLRKIPIRF